MRDYLYRRIDATLVGMPGTRVLVLFVFHAIGFAACYAIAEWLRFEFRVPQDELARVQDAMPVVVAVQLLVGAIFGFYRGWWRYVSIGDAVRLAAGLLTALVLLLGMRLFGATLWVAVAETSAGTLVVDWALALLTVFGARIAVRMAKDRLRADLPDTPPKRVLIVGAGDSGEALAREIAHSPQLGITVAAFVDDKKAKWNSYIRGVVVRGPIEAIGRIARQTHATEALIAMPTAPGPRIREIIQSLAAANLQFKTIPGIDQVVSGRIPISQFRKVNLDDLLRRAPVTLPGDPVRRLFAGKRVLISGAGGTIGSELASQILDSQPESLTLVERSEHALYESMRRLEKQIVAPSRLEPCLLDIRDDESMPVLLRRTAPHFVIHAAAHKQVPLGEDNPLEYLRNNCLATRRLAEWCRDAGVERFVFISTDKATHPMNVMAASKRAAEILLLDPSLGSNMTVSVVRFGNVIESSGSVVPLFLEQIASGGPVTVTHPDVTRYFLRTSEAVALVLQAVVLGDRGQVYALDVGTPVNIADLARDLIRLSNYSTDEIDIVFTGLRPGEELVEDVPIGESVRQTEHPRIVVAQPPQPDAHVIAEWLQRAREVAPRDPSTTASLLLRALVPEYRPDEGPPVPHAQPLAVDAEADQQLSWPA
jgi:FlaA1/EpsC-like NDP-sugar epimerase